jgi:thiol-disulfide isomerase/thioredoxin
LDLYKNEKGGQYVELPIASTEMSVSTEPEPSTENDMEDDAETFVNASTVLDKTKEITPGSYETYTPQKLAYAEKGKVVLFFKASWCPSCRVLDSSIKDNRKNIPDGVTILEVDYDSNTDLRKKYGVTTQHTLVEVDANGDLQQKWSGGSTLGSIVERI